MNTPTAIASGKSGPVEINGRTYRREIISRNGDKPIVLWYVRRPWGWAQMDDATAADYEQLLMLQQRKG